MSCNFGEGVFSPQEHTAETPGILQVFFLERGADLDLKFLVEQRSQFPAVNPSTNPSSVYYVCDVHTQMISQHLVHYSTASLIIISPVGAVIYYHKSCSCILC